MCCDEDKLNRSRRTQRAKSSTMKRPARKSGSLLVDYSKSKASGAEVMKNTPPRTKSMTLASLVQPGPRARTHSLDESSSSIDVSQQSYDLPGLDPMSHRKCLLGASKETMELEGDDSFYQDSCSEILSMDARASVHQTQTTLSPNRRAALQSTRRYQSMSSLSPKRDQRPAGPVLSFSLRRRSTMNTTTSTPASVDANKDLGKLSLHRSKTWDNHNSCSVIRFNESLGALNNTDPLDASEHTTKPATATAVTPAQNRRSMLVRHSSVSALQQQQPPHLKLDNLLMSPAAPAQRPKARRQNSFSVFQSGHNNSSSKDNGIPGPPSMNRTSSTDILEKTIEISEKKPRRKTRKSLSASMHEPRDKTKNERIPKEKRRSSSKNRNGPGALDRHLSNHSRKGSDHSRRSSNGGRRPAGMPTIETDDLSCSSQSYFSRAGGSVVSKASAISKCPSTRSASRRGLLNARSISGGASLLGNMGNSSRQVMRARSNNGIGMMDDSSSFVTGSRIRRGTSCRQLLLA